jgi:transcriptional regulator with XRE-family HTH domain
VTGKRAGEAVGEQVRIARESLRWTQEDLAARLGKIGAHGWRQSKIAKIERGEVKRLTLDDTLELAAALGVQPNRLMAGKSGVTIAGQTIGQHELLQWLEGERPLRAEDRWAWLSLLWTEVEEAQLSTLRRDVGVPILGDVAKEG